MNYDQKRTFKEELALIMRGLKIHFTICRTAFILSIIKAFADSLLPFVNLYMSSLIITKISQSAGVWELIILAVITVCINLIISVFSNYLSSQSTVHNKLNTHKRGLFYNEINNGMQYEHMENAEIYSHRKRLYRTHDSYGFPVLSSDIVQIIRELFSVIFALSLITGMFFMKADGDFEGVFAFVNSPFSSAVVAAMVVINTSVTVILSKREIAEGHKVNGGWSEKGKVIDYFGDLLKGNYAYGMDIRIFNQKDIVKNELKRFMNDRDFLFEIDALSYKYGQIQTLLKLSLNIILYLYIGAKTYIGAFVIGSFILYTGAVWRFVTSFSRLIATFFDLISNNVYMQDIFDYVDLPNAMHKGSLPIERKPNNEYDIEFVNVSFKYPSSELYALKNVSFKFKTNERLAVVGMNGSGKTTMIKLLCRLYDPTEGVITLNGVDIREYDYKSYMDLFSVVFQDFKLFSFPLGQNVASRVGYDADKVVKCLNIIGFGDRFAGMARGCETALYKDFDEDGVEISGGEAQKIALARALYKDAPFIVLDEPTAALDPIAESEIYSKFDEIVKNKTAIYISHRLSSCRFCDDIAVFHEGELVQRGNHNSLIANVSGKYSELWNAQAQYYK